MTYRVALIGQGIAESLSPALHMEEAHHLGLEYEYRILDLAGIPHGHDDLGALLARLRDEGYAGVNVTHPFKQRVISALDRLTGSAATIDAVNLVLIDDTGFSGHNTDWTGFDWSLDTGLPDVELGRVVQVGAGGAGCATAYSLLRRGAQHLTITDVRTDRAGELASRFGSIFAGQRVESVALADLAGALSAADGVVHATPVGMAAHPGMAFDVTAVRSGAWLAEVVYLPLETELIGAARDRGHRVLPGSLMAVGQALESLRLITGKIPDAVRMSAHMSRLTGETL